MSRNTPEGAVLTKFETVLDSHHRTLPLWSHHRPQAIFATLAAFDLMMLPVSIGVSLGGPNAHTVQVAQSLHHGLVYAMQFFWEESPDLAVCPTNEYSVINQAASFLSHCRNYSTLVDFHVGFGRELYTLEVDESRKQIRFIHAPAEGSSPGPSGVLEDTPREWDQMHRVITASKVKSQVVEAVKKVRHHWEDGCLVLDDLSALRQEVFQEILEYVLPGHEPPLDDTENLGGFTAKEYREFWHALFKWSMVASGIYLEATIAGKKQYDHLPTQFVERGRFIEVIEETSGLTHQIVTACLDRLTYGRECPKKPDIFLQPLLCTGGHVAWSPYLVQLCKYKRNMLKLMARVPALKAIADNLIGRREHSLSLQFGELIAKYGYQFKTRIPLPDGTGEIDMLAFHNKHPSELLVIEIKGVLGVDEVNEVDHVTNEMIYAQRQLSNSIRFLQMADVPTKTSLWRGSPSWNVIHRHFGLVLTPNSQPNSRYDHRRLPAITFETMRNYFRERDFRSPERIHKTSADKRWLKKYTGGKDTYLPIQIGDIVYEIPASYVE